MEEKLRQLPFGKAFLIGLVLAAIYYFGPYDSGSNLEASIQGLESQITATKAELDKIKIAIRDAEVFQETKQARGQELDTVLKAIPEQISSLDLMRILSNEAKGVGASILSINHQSGARTVDPKAFFEPVTVTVNLEGSYNTLMQFLSNLTKIDRIITISSLNLKLQDQNIESKGPTLLRMSGEFRAYKYLPQKTGAPAGG